MGIATFTPAVAGQVCTAAYFNGVINAILNQLNGNIETINLANLSVTSGKLASGAVTGPKIAMGSDAQGDILIRGASNYQRLAIGDAGKFLMSNGTGANPSWELGSIIQVIEANTASVITTATQIPDDDSIPQNTEGAEVITATITPVSSTNNLIIIFEASATPSAASQVGTALFQDSTANAIASQIHYGTTGAAINCSLHHFMSAGTTSATTFKIRIGPDVANNLDINGNGSGSRYYGGTMFAKIIILEIKG